MSELTQDKQNLCIDILVNGHVQAYVDFFYLTHRPESVHAADEPSTAQLGIPPAKLPFVKVQLAEAETARRRGDTGAVFTAYEQLAAFFTDLSDQRTAIYFWEKCLEISQLTSDVAGETKTTLALGVAHERSGDTVAAVRHYEKLLRLAQSSGDQSGEQHANERLVLAFQAIATEKEEAKESALALSYREKCLEASRACGDVAKESKAQFELGQAHEQLGDVDHLKKAVYHYEQHLALAETAGDTEAQGAACFALAHVHQRLQNGEASLQNLQKFSQLAQSSGKVSAQAEACCSLGVLYNQQGDYVSAVQYLERFFELARSVGDRSMLDKARTYLGIARGNSVLPSYTQVVTSDLDALLKWKNRRVPFTDALRPANNGT
ncbi:hypothetical protein AB1Y20_012235 [Prymnesium parvum]|uniref:Tetratricopeptide repeat protein 29 n=1 Tax=Prymnesium parvum TaxID=97485 RepID=A0AB34INY0_PRYPA